MTTDAWLARISACSLCQGLLPDAPKPIVQLGLAAPVLIAGQAPGRITRARGRPFDDASGDRLRQWLGVSRAQFYDPRFFSILPMGFCYPGRGSSGDLPPRPECATHWRQALLAAHQKLQLSLLIGQYAQAWHLGGSGPVTERVRHWRQHWPAQLPLPHPSPRNNLWLRRNPWFEAELVPALQYRIAHLLEQV